MSVTLHGALVSAWLQTLDSLAGIMDKAAAFCAEKGIDEASLLDAKLAEDMLPLGFQIKSTWVHSAGAVEGVRRGTFSPDRGPTPESFAEAKAKLVAAREAIAALQPGEIDGLAGGDMVFTAGQFRLDFTNEGFLLSFSLPNFYFHATTTYAILRGQGVPIGKRDYLGKMALKG